MTEITQQKTAAILPIGNEILSGKTLDSNSNWIAQKLGMHGIRLREIRAIPDDKNTIIDAVNTLRRKFSYVFTTGGIGPTHDDITADAMADAFGVNLVRDNKAYEILLDYYGLDEMNPGREKMALIPEGAKLIQNPVTAAPGFRIENVFVMAGVPKIMKAMMEDILDSFEPGLPFLARHISCNYPESVVAELLTAIQTEHSNVDIGSYPRIKEDGSFMVNVVVRGQEEKALESAEKAIQQALESLKKTG